jgi:predicted small lipoprotein YifL
MVVGKRSSVAQSIVFILVAAAGDLRRHDNRRPRSRAAGLAILRESTGNPAMSRTLSLLACCLALALLAGCGNKGPLVLPSHPAAASTAPAPATVAPASQPR